jgi:hypothetical protein
VNGYQKWVIAWCKGDKNCEAAARDLFDFVVKNCPRNTEVLNRCHKWKSDCMGKIIDARRKGKRFNDFHFTEKVYCYHGYKPFWPFLKFDDHGLIEVTMGNGTVFWMDTYLYGGDDHIFTNFPKELEPSKYCKKCQPECVPEIPPGWPYPI